MELAAKYAYKVYQKGSFSRAADELFISQPALSSMVAKLERELGFKIFDRSTSPLTTTPEGQIYIEMLEVVIKSEDTMYRRLEQLTLRQIKQLSVGTSISIANYIMPDVCKEMITRYPGIRIKLNMGEKGVNNVLSKHLSNKDIDFFIGYSYDNKTETAIPLISEKNLIVVRADLVDEDLLPYAMTRTEVLRRDNTKVIDSANLHLFSKLPFITSNAYTGYHRKMANLTANNYSLSCISITNIRNMSMNFDMMRAGLGASIATTTQIIHPLFDDEQIVYFSTNDSTSARTLRAVFRIDEKPSEEALLFIEVFKGALTDRINRIILPEGGA